jgi:hypothetical protein
MSILTNGLVANDQRAGSNLFQAPDDGFGLSHLIPVSALHALI